MALAPDPFDEDIEALMADPEFRRKLEDFDERDARGEVRWHSDEAARELLRRRGIPVLDDAPPSNAG